MTRELVFNVPEIKEKGGLAFAKEAAAGEFFPEGEGPSGSCRIHLEFSLGGNQLLMEGRVDGGWVLPCSRCLAQHERLFQIEIEETYPLSQQEVDVREEVREALVLSVPSKSLCTPSCRGLCPSCGQNLNQASCPCSEMSN